MGEARFQGWKPFFSMYNILSVKNIFSFRPIFNRTHKYFTIAKLNYIYPIGLNN